MHKSMFVTSMLVASEIHCCKCIRMIASHLCACALFQAVDLLAGRHVMPWQSDLVLQRWCGDALLKLHHPVRLLLSATVQGSHVWSLYRLHC